jgi:hypothetical protein
MRLPEPLSREVTVKYLRMQSRVFLEAVNVKRFAGSPNLLRRLLALSCKIVLFCVLFSVMIYSSTLHIWGANNTEATLALLICLGTAAIFVCYRRMIIILVFAGLVSTWDIVKVVMSNYYGNGEFGIMSIEFLILPFILQSLVLGTSFTFKFLLDALEQQKLDKSDVLENEI